MVELLVVVGIIAVLMGILLPSLSAAQSQAQAVACVANVRQIGAAALLYAQDHKRYVSYVRFPPTDPRPPIDRKELLHPYLDQGKNNADTEGRQVWNCPSNERPQEEASYGFNTDLNGVKLARIKRPAETVALCDAGLADAPAGAPSLATHCWPPGKLASPGSCRPNHKRHPNKTVAVAYVDGRAERTPIAPPFYPGPMGTYTPNGITDRHHADYQNVLWDLE